MKLPQPPLPMAVILTWMTGVTSWAAPPVLNRLTLPNSIADVSAGQGQLPIEIDFSAPEGITRVEMQFLSAAGDAFDHYVSPIAQPSAITGTKKAGVYRGYLVVPAFRQADTWTISATVFDAAGGSTDYPMLPVGSSTVLTTINTGSVDLAPPVLTSAVLSSGVVDITSGSQTVTITATAQDDTGIESLSVSLYDPGDRYRTGSYLTSLQMISGTARNGTWQATLSVPAFGPSGTYPVDYYLRDESNRGTYYSNESNISPNVQASLNVLSSGPVDTAGPLLTSASSTHAEVDVTHSPQTVRLDVAVQDAPAGLQEVRIGLESPGGPWLDGGWPYADREAPFTNGIVQTGMEFTIPRYTPPGIYRWSVTATDGADFESKYGSWGLPFPGEFSGTLLVVNNGPSRGSPPVATGFTMSPPALPEAGLPGLVEYTVQINDPSAVKYVTAFFSNLSGFREEFPLKLVEGTPHNGTWQGRFRISKAKLPGDYRTGFRITDETGDEATYGTWPNYAIPYAAGWPVNFRITPGGTALTAYQTWCLAHSGLGEGGGAESDDPDRDGWPNALEFICGMDPLSSSTKGMDDTYNGDSTPRIQWNPISYSMEYYLSLPNLAMGSGTDLKVKGWKSSTLSPASWQPVSPISLGPEFRLIRLDVPSYSRPQQFLKLTVEP